MVNPYFYLQKGGHFIFAASRIAWYSTVWSRDLLIWSRGRRRWPGGGGAMCFRSPMKKPRFFGGLEHWFTMGLVWDNVGIMMVNDGF